MMLQLKCLCYEFTISKFMILVSTYCVFFVVGLFEYFCIFSQFFIQEYFQFYRRFFFGFVYGRFVSVDDDDIVFRAYRYGVVIGGFIIVIFVEDLNLEQRIDINVILNGGVMFFGGGNLSIRGYLF